MELWTEKIATLSLPSVVVFLLGLTVVRCVLRALRTTVFVFLSEIIESAILAVVVVYMVLRPFLFQSYHIPTVSMRPTLIEGDHLLVNKLIYRLREPSYGEIIVFRAPPEADPTEKEFVKRLIGRPGDVIEVRPGYVQVGEERFDHARIRDVLGVPQPVGGRDEQRDDAPTLRLTGEEIILGERRISPAEFATKAGLDGQLTLIQPGLVYRNGKTLIEDYIAEDPDYVVPPTQVPPGTYYVLGDNRNQSHDSHYWQAFSADRLIGRADLIYWPLRRLWRVQNP